MGVLPQCTEGFLAMSLVLTYDPYCKKLLCNILNCVLLLASYLFTSILLYSMIVSSLQEVFPSTCMQMRKKRAYKVTNRNKIHLFFIFLFYFFLIFLFTQYITQIVQIQAQHTHAHDWRDNKLIFWLLPHSHDIVLYYTINRAAFVCLSVCLFPYSSEVL